ncbi:hypothetical protein ACOTD6_29375, partial [Achromobacter xylosoxidans]
SAMSRVLACSRIFVLLQFFFLENYLQGEKDVMKVSLSEEQTLVQSVALSPARCAWSDIAAHLQTP